MVPSDMDLDPQQSTHIQGTRPVSGGSPVVAAGPSTTSLGQKELAATTSSLVANSLNPQQPTPLSAMVAPQSFTTTTVAATTAPALESEVTTNDQEHPTKIDVTMDLPAKAAINTIATTSPSTNASSVPMPASSPNTGQFNPTVHRPSLAAEAALAAVKAVRENPSKMLSNGGSGENSNLDKHDKDIEMDVEGDETEDDMHATAVTTAARRSSVNGHLHHHDEDADGEDDDEYDAAPTATVNGGREGAGDGTKQTSVRSQPLSQHGKKRPGRHRKTTSALTSSSTASSLRHHPTPLSPREHITPPPSASSPSLTKDDSPLDGQNVTEEKYRRLKRKLKEVLQENERMAAELERSHRRVRNLRKEKNLLLDKIIQYERAQESESASELSTSLSSDSESSDASLHSRRSERPWTSSSRNINGGRRDGSSASARLSAAATGSAGSGPHHPRKTASRTPRRRSPSTSGMTPFSGSTAPGEGDGAADGHHHLSPPAQRAAHSTAKNKDNKPAPMPSLITNVGSAFQKPKRIHTSAKQRATNMMKVKKVLPLARDENGNVKLPCTIGILTVMNLGKVIWDREAFHNERYIWPVGYKMSRLYNSMIDKNSQTTYTCSVIDDGDAPKFMIEVGDQPGKPIIAGTATGAWTHVVKAANEIRKRDHSNSASGPDYFGFSNPTIAKLIQELPDADKCEHYIMQRFEEGTGRSGSAAQAAAGEKRRLGRGSGSASLAAGDDKGKEGGEGGKDGEHESSKEDELDEEDDSDYVSLGTSGIKPPPTKKQKVGTSSSHDDDSAMAVDSGDGSATGDKSRPSDSGAMHEDIDIEANDDEEEDHEEHEEEEIDELDDDDDDDDDNEDDMVTSAPPPSSSGPTAPSASSSSSTSSNVQQDSSPGGQQVAASTGSSTLAASAPLLNDGAAHASPTNTHAHHEKTMPPLQEEVAPSVSQEPVHSIAASTSSVTSSGGPSVIVTSE